MSLQAARCRIPFLLRFPVVLASLAGILVACLDNGGKDEEAWAELRSEVPVSDAATLYDAALIPLPDSSVLALRIRLRDEDSGRPRIVLTKVSSRGKVAEENIYEASEPIEVFRISADAYPSGNGYVAAWIERGDRPKIKVLAEERSLGRTGPIDVTPPGVLFPRHVSVLALPDFGFAVACAFIDSAESDPRVSIRRFEFSGRPPGEAPFLAEPSRIQDIFSTALLRRPGGGWMALWKEARLNDPSQIAVQVFSPDGTASGTIRRWNAPGCFVDPKAPLKAFPYPRDRILIQSGGFTPACGALMSWSGDQLQGFTPNPWFYEETRFAAVDSGRGHYLAHTAGHLRLHDSTMKEIGARKIPHDTATQAFCVAASGQPVLLTGLPGEGYRVLFYDPFWR